MSTASRAEAQAYYEDFSLSVGLRDWLQPNERHEQIKLLLGDTLDSRPRWRSALDVGCGGGVLTSFLAERVDEVVGVDFSTAAIAAARHLVPAARFEVGSVAEGRFDLVTLFDVLEHIPAGERPGFIAVLAEHVAGDGVVFATTPHPGVAARRRAEGDPTQQIIDEAVQLRDVIDEARAVGLELLRYETYDIWKGSPEYQMMVFAAGTRTTGPPVLRSPRRERRMRLLRIRGVVRTQRVARAVRLRVAGSPAARWMLTGVPPRVDPTARPGSEPTSRQTIQERGGRS